MSFNETDLLHRVEKAGAALQGYLENRESPTLDTNETALVDLLADLRHWADANGLDLGKADRLGYHHYLEEKANG